MGQLVHKVPIACGSLARYYGNAFYDSWQLKLFVHIEDAVALQLLYNCLTPSLHIAQSVGRVHHQNVAAQTIEGGVCNFDIGHYFHANLKWTTRLLIKVAQRLTLLTLPNVASQLSRILVCVGYFLNKVEVYMPVFVHLRHLGHHPSLHIIVLNGPLYPVGKRAER